MFGVGKKKISPEEEAQKYEQESLAAFQKAYPDLGSIPGIFRNNDRVVNLVKLRKTLALELANRENWPTLRAEVEKMIRLLGLEVNTKTFSVFISTCGVGGMLFANFLDFSFPTK
jgi:hypothetical protein